MALLTHITWTAMSQATRQALQFGIGIALARLLTPYDFGLIGLGAVFVGFASIFSGSGLSAAIVQKQDVSAEELDFAFWLNVATGCLLAALVCIAAPLIAGFYGEPRLVRLTMLSATGFIIGSIGIVPTALLQKAFEFRQIACVDIVATLLAGAIAIVMARMGFGVYSLVLQGLASQLLTSVPRWFLVDWRPSFRWSPGAGRRMMSFSANVLGFDALNYWVRNSDNLLVGKACGASELGLYSRAYNLMLLPVTQVQSVLFAVMFTTMSALQHDRNRVRELYLNACQAVALVMFPVMTGLIVVADDLVLVIWGPQWLGVVPIIRILAIAGIGNSIGTTSGWVFGSCGRPDLMLKWALFVAPILIVAFSIGVSWGGLGVATAYLVTYVILWYPMWRLTGSLIGLSFGAAMRNLAGPFAAAVGMTCLMAVLRMLMIQGMAPQVRLLICIVCGGLSYLSFVSWLRIPVGRLMVQRFADWLADKRVAHT